MCGTEDRSWPVWPCEPLREVWRSGVRVLCAALRLLPVLLATQRGEVEEVVGAAGHLGSTGVDGVGVEDAVAVAQEVARAGLLDRLLAVDVVVGARPLVLLLGPVV